MANFIKFVVSIKNKIKDYIKTNLIKIIKLILIQLIIKNNIKNEINLSINDLEGCAIVFVVGTVATVMITYFVNVVLNDVQELKQEKKELNQEINIQAEEEYVKSKEIINLYNEYQDVSIDLIIFKTGFCLLCIADAFVIYMTGVGFVGYVNRVRFYRNLLISDSSESGMESTDSDSENGE